MSFVSVLDNLIVWVFLSAALISLLLPKSLFPWSVSPFASLSLSTNLVASLSRPLSLLQDTEVSLLQGAGVAS